MITDKYELEIENATNEIELKTATKSQRVGKGKIRDTVVFARAFWNEAFSFISPIQTIIILIALTSPAIVKINAGLASLGGIFGIKNVFQFPVESTSIFGFLSMIFIFIFGFIIVRYFGTYKSANEMAAKMNPAIRILWKKDELILEYLEKIEKRLDSLEKR